MLLTVRSEGYHIFAAAIVAKYFPEWGVKHHEAVTLLIRDIANPSSSDPFFPVFRHKVSLFRLKFFPPARPLRTCSWDRTTSSIA